VSDPASSPASTPLTTSGSTIVTASQSPGQEGPAENVPGSGKNNFQPLPQHLEVGSLINMLGAALALLITLYIYIRTVEVEQRKELFKSISEVSMLPKIFDGFGKRITSYNCASIFITTSDVFKNTKKEIQEDPIKSLRKISIAIKEKGNQKSFNENSLEYWPEILQSLCHLFRKYPFSGENGIKNEPILERNDFTPYQSGEVFNWYEDAKRNFQNVKSFFQSKEIEPIKKILASHFSSEAEPEKLSPGEKPKKLSPGEKPEKLSPGKSVERILQNTVELREVLARYIKNVKRALINYQNSIRSTYLFFISCFISILAITFLIFIVFPMMKILLQSKHVIDEPYHRQILLSTSLIYSFICIFLLLSMFITLPSDFKAMTARIQ
jgi:hypothetical protein